MDLIQILNSTESALFASTQYRDPAASADLGSAKTAVWTASVVRFRLAMMHLMHVHAFGLHAGDRDELCLIATDYCNPELPHPSARHPSKAHVLKMATSI